MFRLVPGSIADVVVGVVLDQPLAHFIGEVKPGEVRISSFELLNHAHRLALMVEPAAPFHTFVEDAFARVAEGGMPQIMSQTDALNEILVGAEGARHRPPDLGDLDGMRKSRAVVVPFVVDEDLGLVGEAAEGGRMDDAIAIALKGGAVGRLLFGKDTATRGAALHRVRSKDRFFTLFQPGTRQHRDSSANTD